MIFNRSRLRNSNLTQRQLRFLSIIHRGGARLLALIFLAGFALACPIYAAAVEQPNIVVILTDDLGYGDLSCYGADDIATPHIDRMAADGNRFSSFYVAPVCSPSRAALMTGCYGQRVGIGGVLFPRNNTGLNPQESTLPELLKEQGYSTALIGKWHLGNQDIFQPLNHGFDTWYGTPSSNSQFYYPHLKQYSKDCIWREGYSRKTILKMEEAKCPLVRDNVVIEVPADQTQFTQRYTNETIKFIRAHKDSPFFVCLAHNMPHLPIHVSDAFVGISKRGKYGDAIQELDWSTGKILEEINNLGLDNRTLVIFTSDNGPNLGRQGRAAPLRGGKGTTFEGGVRVPFVARFPKSIARGRVTDEPATIMDLLPTLVRLAGGKLKSPSNIDGKDIWPLLVGHPNAKSPHEAIYYMRGRSVQGIRVGEWKYRLASSTPKKKTKERKPTKATVQNTAQLYNLNDDVGENENLIGQEPQIAARLRERMESFAVEIRANQRPAGIAEPTLEAPTP